MMSASRKRGIVMPMKETKDRTVDPGVLPGRGKDAEADADHGGQKMADQRDGDGGRQALGQDHVGHGLVVGSRTGRNRLR